MPYCFLYVYAFSRVGHLDHPWSTSCLFLKFNPLDKHRQLLLNGFMMNQEKLISIGAAAKYLGISRDTLRRWEKAGKIETIRSPTNRRYYTKKILNDAMARKKTQPSSRPPVRKTRRPSPQKAKLFISGTVSFVIAVVLAVLVVLFLL